MDFGLFAAMEISASGMAAQRKRMDVIAMNLSNAHSTRGPGGGPYRRMQVVFETVLEDVLSEEEVAGGVRVAGVVGDQNPFVEIQAPGHPDAADGVLELPNVDPVLEMADMISASRSYEANVAAFRAGRGMVREAMRLWSS
jgi:flagellar basal-body rod protein FlgC